MSLLKSQPPRLSSLKVDRLKLGLRLFYEEDIKAPLALVRSEIVGVYVGPGWRSINWYERLGRVIAGTGLVLVWLLICIGAVLLFFATVMMFFKLVRCLFNPACQIAIQPRE